MRGWLVIIVTDVATAEMKNCLSTDGHFLTVADVKYEAILQNYYHATRTFLWRVIDGFSHGL